MAKPLQELRRPCISSHTIDWIQLAQYRGKKQAVLTSVLYFRTRMEEGRGVHKVLVGKPGGKSHWGDQDVDGRILLRLIFRKWEGVVETG